LPMQVKRLLERKVRARELQTLGRSVPWHTRPLRSKVPPPAPTTSSAAP